MVVINEDLFKLVHLGTYPFPMHHLVVATETVAHTVPKRVVCILLECCLFVYYFEDENHIRQYCRDYRR